MMQPETQAAVGVLLKSLGRHMPRQRYQRGSLEKVGKLSKNWQGRYQVYVKLADGTEKRRDRTKILGPATMSKGEAQRLLDALIEESSRPHLRMALPADPTFEDLWTRYVELKKASWGSAARKAIVSVFSGRSKKKKTASVLMMLGDVRVAKLTRDPLQECLNAMATRGDSHSAVKKARTYLAAVLEYAVDEKLIEMNPARNIELPTKLIARKACGLFYSLNEVQLLLSTATGREHLTLRLFIVCGLRPSELLLLRCDDLSGDGMLRVDESLKDTEKGEKRIGDTKTTTSAGYVAISGDLQREIEQWIFANGFSGRDLMFPSEAGTPFRIGNYLKRELKPIGEAVGITDLTHQAMRRTCATHFQRHGGPRDAQAQLRHSELAMTGLYMKEIPEQVRAAVESMDAELNRQPGSSRVN